jgi:RNA polymerase sigma-70 factor (ECF subfamily)
LDDNGWHLGQWWLTELMARYWEPLVRYVARSIPDADDVEGVVQETFEAAWHRYERDDPPQEWAPWLYKTARNIAYEQRTVARRAGDLWRRLTRQPVPGHHDGDIGLSESYQDVAAAVRVLTAEQRECLMLHVDGFSDVEIAEIVGVSVANVRTLRLRARRELRKALNGDIRRRVVGRSARGKG